MRTKSNHKWSLFIGRVAGIKIYLHWTFIVLILWVIMSEKAHGQGVEEIVFTVLFILSVFLCITLHELGHALTARRYNCATRHILLLPIGGIAQLEKFPEKPKEEMLVSLAGPAVNLIIAGILYFVIIYGSGIPRFDQLSLINKETFILNLFIVNIMLFVFNLIPAFPMDGGRVLRALLSLKYQRFRATRIAATIGQLIAILFVFGGMFYNPYLVFIGVFIFLGAQIEADYYESKHFLKSYHIRDLVIHQFHTLHATSLVHDAIRMLLDVQATSFLVEEGGKVVGTLSRKEILNAISAYGENIELKVIMNKQINFLNADQMVDEVYSSVELNSSSLCPVIENDKVIGVVDRENIMEFILVQNALKKFNDSSHLIKPAI